MSAQCFDERSQRCEVDILKRLESAYRLRKRSRQSRPSSTVAGSPLASTQGATRQSRVIFARDAHCPCAPAASSIARDSTCARREAGRTQQRSAHGSSMQPTAAHAPLRSTVDACALSLIPRRPMWDRALCFNKMRCGGYILRSILAAAWLPLPILCKRTSSCSRCMSPPRARRTPMYWFTANATSRLKGV